MIEPDKLFRALSEPTRLHCLLLLLTEERHCVCELVHALDLSQPLISRHLRHLRDQGLVTDTRRGQWVYYELSPELPAWVREILEAVLRAHSLEGVRQRLENMPNRPSLSCD